MLTWRLETAAVGDGLWFVAVRPRGICVIAPPGVFVTRAERQRELSDGVSGWRRATWARNASGDWPIIDSEPPDSVRDIDTRSVLRMVGEDWREVIWCLLLAQLEDARSLGVWGTGASSEAWLAAALEAAFPERAHLVARPVKTVERQNQTPDDRAGRAVMPTVVMPDATYNGLKEGLDAAIVTLTTISVLCWLECWLRERLQARPKARRVAHFVYMPIRKSDERVEARRQAMIADSIEVSLLQSLGALIEPCSGPISAQSDYRSS